MHNPRRVAVFALLVSSAALAIAQDAVRVAGEHSTANAQTGISRLFVLFVGMLAPVAAQFLEYECFRLDNIMQVCRQSLRSAATGRLCPSDITG
jgi:hypothetical protein